VQLELNGQEAELLKLLLVKELEETRVEIHHAKNIEFKTGLGPREHALRHLIGRIEPAKVT
jgi:hypothetical protein